MGLLASQELLPDDLTLPRPAQFNGKIKDPDSGTPYIRTNAVPFDVRDNGSVWNDQSAIYKRDLLS
jgi:hypothetical protein